MTAIAGGKAEGFCVGEAAKGRPGGVGWDPAELEDLKGKSGLYKG